MKAVLYVHGKGGSAGEAKHYAPLFPDADVTGLDYKTFTPWETGAEIRAATEKLKARYESVTLIANSIGACFSMSAGIDALIARAYFISPVVDMEGMILGMMAAEGVTEAELEARGVIPTGFGEDLSWEYLSRVRRSPVRWRAPTFILYGENDALVPYGAVAAFAEEHGSPLTVMPGGEHWFHTPRQIAFLDEWIKSNE